MRMLWVTVALALVSAAVSEQTCTLGRLFLSDVSSSTVTSIDLDTGATNSIPGEGFSSNPSIFASSAASHVLVNHRSDTGTVRIIDAGFDFESHGDHYDIGMVTPTALPLKVEGDMPTHVTRGHGQTTIFFDGRRDTNSSVVAFEDTGPKLLGAALVHSFMYGPMDPQDGNAGAMANDLYFVTAPNPKYKKMESDSSLPTGVRVLDKHGDLIYDANVADDPDRSCPGYHGHGHHGEYHLFGCSSGILVLHQSAATNAVSTRLMPYHDTGRRTGAFFSHHENPVIIARHSSPYALIRWQSGTGNYDASRDVLEFAADVSICGAAFELVHGQALLVLFNNGTLIAYDVSTAWTPIAALSVVPAFHCGGHGGGGHPILIAGYNRVFVTVPDSKAVREVHVSHDHLELGRLLAAGVEAGSGAVAGLSAEQAEVAACKAEEHDDEHHDDDGHDEHEDTPCGYAWLGATTLKKGTYTLMMSKTDGEYAAASVAMLFRKVSDEYQDQMESLQQDADTLLACDDHDGHDHGEDGDDHDGHDHGDEGEDEHEGEDHHGDDHGDEGEDEHEGEDHDGDDHGDEGEDEHEGEDHDGDDHGDEGEDEHEGEDHDGDDHGDEGEDEHEGEDHHGDDHGDEGEDEHEGEDHGGDDHGDEGEDEHEGEDHDGDDHGEEETASGQGTRRAGHSEASGGQGSQLALSGEQSLLVMDMDDKAVATLMTLDVPEDGTFLVFSSHAPYEFQSDSSWLLDASGEAVEFDEIVGGTECSSGLSSSEVWGYSFLGALLCAVASLVGIVFIIPVLSNFREQLIIYLHSLAAGVLLALVVVHLIPEAIALSDKPWKVSTCVMAGFAAGLLIEHGLRLFSKGTGHTEHAHHQENNNNNKQQDRALPSSDPNMSVVPAAMQGPPASTTEPKPVMMGQPMVPTWQTTYPAPQNAAYMFPPMQPMQPMPPYAPHAPSYAPSSMSTSGVNFGQLSFTDSAPPQLPPTFGHQLVSGSAFGVEARNDTDAVSLITDSDAEAEAAAAKRALALNILVGDLFHNFFDGIIIATGFRVCGHKMGWTLTAAAIVHEIPQELSDFVILVEAGMSMKTALLLNFCSSLSAILGMIILLALDEITQDVDRSMGIVLGIGAGVMLYIAADLIPGIIAVNDFAKARICWLIFAFGACCIGILQLWHEHCSCEENAPVGVDPHAGHNH